MEHHVQGLLADVQRQLQLLEKEKEKLRKEREFIADAELSKAAIVNLNVGGFKFSTTLSTLCADRESMLATMFSGRHQLAKDPEGYYFIDRDGRYFDHILNWLRDGTLLTSRLPHEIRESLMREARYYQLAGLARELKKGSSEHVVWIQGLSSYHGPFTPNVIPFGFQTLPGVTGPVDCSCCGARIEHDTCGVCATPKTSNLSPSFQDKMRYLLAKGWRPSSGVTATQNEFGVFMEK